MATPEAQWLGEFALTAGPIGGAMLCIYAVHARLRSWVDDRNNAKDKSGAVTANRTYIGFWVFTLGLILAGSAFTIYEKIIPSADGMIRGAIRGLPSTAEVAGPEGMYQRRAADGFRRKKIIFLLEPNGTDAIDLASVEIRESVERDAWTVACDLNLAALKALKFKFDSDKLDLLHEASGEDGHIGCEPLDSDSPLASLDRLVPAPAIDTAWFSMAAKAADGAVPWAEIADALTSPDASVQNDARRYLADQFNDYLEPSYRVLTSDGVSRDLRLNVMWALSRRDPLDRPDLFAPVDLPEDVWRAVINAAVSTSDEERVIGRRIVASYPAMETRKTVERIGAAEGLNTDEGFQSLLRHYDYNRGVLTAIAIMDGRQAPTPDEAQAGFDRILQSENGQPTDQDRLKALYGKGFVAAVSADAMPGAFKPEQANEAFETFLEEVETTTSTYRYRSQVNNAQGYLKEGYAVFR